MSQHKMIINDNSVTYHPGDTILETARRNQIEIPTMCHLKRSTPTGACRICVVEVKGARSLVTACTTPTAKDMVIHTESPKVLRVRKQIVKLMLSNGNHNCLTCSKSGECELQDLAVELNVRERRISGEKIKAKLDQSSPGISLSVRLQPLPCNDSAYFADSGCSSCEAYLSLRPLYPVYPELPVGVSP